MPSLVYWRGRLAPRHSLQMVTVQDVLPTVLAAIDVDGPPEGLDGADRWPSIEGETDMRAPDYVTQARGDLAYYRYPWKLIQRGSGAVELYHLGDDPTEQVDLGGEEDRAPWAATVRTDP